MDCFALLSLLLAFVGWFCFYIFSSTWLYRRSSKLPPGPYPFPIIGNILELGKNPNQSLARLAKTYGNLMSLKLGSKTTIVVSSPAIARQVLQKNDLIFSSRTIPGAVQVQNHYKFSMVWLPASGPWRNLRKITKEHMFAGHKLDATRDLRRKKFQELHDYLLSSSPNQQQGINIGEAAFITSLNLISNTLFSVDFVSYDSNSAQELKDIVWGIMEIVGTPNLADFFPILEWIDPQGIKKRSNFIFGKMFDILDDIINQRQLIRAGKSSNTSSSKKNDLLEALLDQIDKNDFSHNDIKHLLLDVFVAGTDTTSATVEWAMTELLRNPEKMATARAEIDQVIGKKTATEGEGVDESDIPKLPYLQGIVKETFRLHPVAPLLVPHKANADVEINGYTVPKDARVLINVWASGRDAETWSDPETFCPERFMQSEIEVGGQHFELIPFGAGRRICPGLPLAYRMVHLLLATFLHGFDWKLEDEKKPKDIDMEQKFGLSVQKAVPLIAIPVKL